MRAGWRKRVKNQKWKMKKMRSEQTKHKPEVSMTEQDHYKRKDNTALLHTQGTHTRSALWHSNKATTIHTFNLLHADFTSQWHWKEECIGEWWIRSTPGVNLQDNPDGLHRNKHGKLTQQSIHTKWQSFILGSACKGMQMCNEQM